MSHLSLQQKYTEQTEKSSFPWSHQRIKVTGQTSPWNLERQMHPERHSHDSLTGSRSCGSRSYWEHRMGGLTSCWRLRAYTHQCEMKISEGHFLGGPTFSQALPPRKLTRFSQWRSKKHSWLWQGKGRVITETCLLHDEGPLSEEKTFPELYYNWRTGISPTPTAYLAFLSHWRQNFL